MSTELGVYRGITTTRLSWTAKLWCLAVYWNMSEVPRPYGTFTDQPFILDVNMVMPRLGEEIQALRHANNLRLERTLDVRSFVDPLPDHRSPPPYRDPTPSTSPLDLLDRTLDRDQILRSVDDRIRAHGPPLCPDYNPLPPSEEASASPDARSTREAELAQFMQSKLEQMEQSTDLQELE
jgi:hypothetical protein